MWTSRARGGGGGANAPIAPPSLRAWDMGNHLLVDLVLDCLCPRGKTENFIHKNLDNVTCANFIIFKLGKRDKFGSCHTNAELDSLHFFIFF